MARIMSQSGILIVHLREAISEEQIRSDLLSIFELEPGQIASLEEATAVTFVPYQIIPRARGFRTTLELYVGRAPQTVPQTDTRLAAILAKHYQQDVLIAPQERNNNPFRWDLVRPSGQILAVSEAPQDHDDGIVIQESV
jgi:hypothetical protein